MRKEMLKGVTVAVLTVAFAFAAAVVSANAQSSNRVAAVIPFEFTVGNQTMTSGEYLLGSITQGGDGLVIKNGETGKSVIRLSHSIEPNGKQRQARLVFHKYGQRYFLAEVWAGGNSTGRQLVGSREERAARREFEKLARSSYETVELLARVR